MICSNCAGPRETVARYCNKCHAAYMREWRKSHPLTEAQRVKDRARSYAGVYKRRGLITEMACKCGAKAEMHHNDYSWPLLVEWLCRQCHLAHHRKVSQKH